MTITYKTTGKTVTVDTVQFHENGNALRFHSPTMGWSPWTAKDAIEDIGPDVLVLA